MNKHIFIFATTVTATLLTACSSGVSEEAYQSLSTQVSEAESRLDRANEKYDVIQREYGKLSASYRSLDSKYYAYKESMNEYEDLADSDVSARKASIAAQKESIASSKAADEEIGYETGITYDQLSRTPNSFNGKKVKFTGKVLQAMEGSLTSDPAIRLAVNKNYNTVLYGKYHSDIISSRILEDDIITIYGTSYGLESYQSTLGGTITIPYVFIDKIEY
jgi:outer membrane murein-binding lipoprotein Lpp